MAKAEKATILTPEGLRRLVEELEHLKTVRRKEVAARIKQAKEFGWTYIAGSGGMNILRRP